jgi:hypothetical protein
MKTRVRDAAARARNLTPFQTDTYPRRGLTGDYAAVCTPVQTVPGPLQQAQADRTAFYMSNHTEDTGYGRRGPAHGPRYYVTSRAQLIAWVTLDGQTHFTDEGELPPLARKHQAMIRAAWPTRFATNSRMFEG